MRRLTATAALAVAAVPAALALSACGTVTIDDSKLESKLTTDISKQAGWDPATVKTACPDDQKAEKGDKFTCVLTGPDGSKNKVVVTQTDDKGNVTFASTIQRQDNTVNTATLEEKLRIGLSKDAGVDPAGVKVACPDGEKAEKGRTFDCTLTTPEGEELKVVVTLTDDKGGYTASVPQ